MATPHDPEGDPAPGGVPDEDAVWRSIVENYGERPELGETHEGPALSDHEAPRPGPRPDPAADPARDPARDPAPDPEEHFVPPAPPPLPRPEPRRLLAWLGLFGVPMFVLLALVLGLVLPSWLGLLLMVWFVGGFVFLVASMRPGGEDDFDDGAVL